MNVTSARGSRLVASAPAAVAGYPVRMVALRFGEVALNLAVVKRLEDHVDAEALLRDADAPEPPYWAHLWAGSRALARLVATQVECRGRRIVDIGCGLGLTGIVAARCGATVTLIDTANAAVRFARANAALNRCSVTVIQADLQHPGLRGRFDYCLAADVTYDPALQTALASFVADHLKPGGRAWCAESVRTTDPGFRHACQQHGLQVSERMVREPEDGRDIDVRLTEVQHRRRW